jgi:hypothetical protein
MFFLIECVPPRKHIEFIEFSEAQPKSLIFHKILYWGLRSWTDYSAATFEKQFQSVLIEELESKGYRVHIGRNIEQWELRRFSRHVSTEGMGGYDFSPLFLRLMKEYAEVNAYDAIVLIDITASGWARYGYESTNERLVSVSIRHRIFDIRSKKLIIGYCWEKSDGYCWERYDRDKIRVPGPLLSYKFVEDEESCIKAAVKWAFREWPPADLADR